MSEEVKELLKEHDYDFSLTELEEFTQMPIWQYIFKAATEKRVTIRDELESGFTSTHDPLYPDKPKLVRLAYEEVRYLQGEAGSLVWLLSLIPTLQAIAKEKLDKQNIGGKDVPEQN